MGAAFTVFGGSRDFRRGALSDLVLCRHAELVLSFFFESGHRVRRLSHGLPQIDDRPLVPADWSHLHYVVGDGTVSGVLGRRPAQRGRVLANLVDGRLAGRRRLAERVLGDDHLRRFRRFSESGVVLGRDAEDVLGQLDEVFDVEARLAHRRPVDLGPASGIAALRGLHVVARHRRSAVELRRFPLQHARPRGDVFHFQASRSARRTYR